ncbi:hypothetical protein F5B21DRAFT_485965 [Xylaria acuta]|nr:hypothetical protein F5B21DRAFT_485965 [Xylaria acuta]
MDPFATLSTAAAIAQFVELSAKLIAKAYDAYNSVSGLPAEDEQLDFIMSELSRLSDAIVPTKPGFEQSDAEKALARIAAKCHALAEQLLGILARIKAKEPHSPRRSAAAALRSWWNEKEKKQLKAQADGCRELLQMQLTIVMGSDTLKALKQLASTGLANEAELASLQKNVGALQKGVTLSHLGTETEAKLASLLELSDSALDSIASHRILNCLSFPEMHRRYSQVGKAFSETFEWIFEEKPQKDERALRGSSRFKEWLESGSGIFHIAGKPGAGKSTLMKFLYKHERTKQHLESWAEGRRLVVGKFFFWRPGPEMENSITAMVRTLLYEVFEQCPELVQRAFPRQWSLVRKLPWQATVQLNFEGDEIRDAFNRLLEHRNRGEKRCFCLFIDGLDEFRENRDEGYKALNSLLSGWTKDAHDDIKVCVSSREYVVFLDSFSGPQGLKLQDLTFGDILTFVREKLEKNQRFLALEKPEGKAGDLVSRVVERASGVFLWVALVVQMLDDACDHLDTFAELQRKLEFTPPEIEDLFQQLFDSIHISDRDQSAQAFEIILRLLAYESGPLSLWRYSLLDKYNQDPEFALKPDFEDQDFFHEDETNVKLRLERARRQLYKRCKGLLEITHSGRDVLGGEVGLTHRSVHEFLLRSNIEDERLARLQNFNVFGATYQTLVAELALQCSKESKLTHPILFTDFTFIIRLLAGLGPDSEEFMPALWNLQKMNHRHIKTWCGPESGGIDDDDRNVKWHTMVVPNLAARCGLRQYFTSNRRPSFAVDGVDYGGVLLGLLSGIIRSDKSSHDQNEILRWIFQQGCSPNRRVFRDEDASLWTTSLAVCLSIDGLLHEPYIAEILQICLKFGAYTEISLSCPGKDVIVEGPPPIGMSQLRRSSRANPIRSDSMMRSVSRALKHRLGKDPITLRSYISSIEAVNKEALLALLDQSPLAQQKVIAPTPVLLKFTLDGEKTPSKTTAKLEDITVVLENTGSVRKRVTAEKMIVWIQWALRNPIFTFALGGILGVLAYLSSYLATSPPKQSI